MLIVALDGGSKTTSQFPADELLIVLRDEEPASSPAAAGEPERASLRNRIRRVLARNAG